MSMTAVRAPWARPLFIPCVAGLLTLAACGHPAEPAATPATHAAGDTETSIRDGFVTSADGTKIHYREGGQGEMALFFLHGWLGNTHWWDEQLTHFAPRYRVVAMDVAGHGESGKDRKVWSHQASARDARAVADKLGLKRIVWIGHSLSGELIIETANQMPDRTVCLVPIDTLQQLGGPATAEETQADFAPLEKDFVGTVQARFKKVFVPGSPELVVRRVLDEAAKSDPAVSAAILRATYSYDGRSEARKVKVPIVAVNSDREPTRLDDNRKYAPQFEVITMKSVGHWPMLERPAEFDQLLQQAIDRGAAPR